MQQSTSTSQKEKSRVENLRIHLLNMLHGLGRFVEGQDILFWERFQMCRSWLILRLSSRFSARYVFGSRLHTLALLLRLRWCGAGNLVEAKIMLDGVAKSHFSKALLSSLSPDYVPFPYGTRGAIGLVTTELFVERLGMRI